MPRKATVKTMSSFVGIRIFGAATLFGAVTLVSRSWPSTSSDEFVFLLAVATVARLIAPLGLEQYIFRTVSPHTFNLRALIDCIGPYLLKSLSLQAVVVILAAIGANLGVSLAIQASIVWTCSALVAISSSTLRSMDKKILSQMGEALVFPLLLLCYLLVGGKSSSAVSVSTIIAATTGLLLIWKAPPTSETDSHALPQFSQLAYLPAVLASITVILAVKGPILLATSILQTGSATALDVAARPALIASLVTTAIGQFFSPQIANTLNRQMPKATNSYCIKGGLVSGIWGLFAIGGLALAGPGMFSTFFGARYADSWKISLIYCVAITVNSFLSLYSVTLILDGAGYHVSVANFVNLVCVSTGILLAAQSGSLVSVALGALVGACAREGLVVAMYVYRQRRKHPQTVQPSRETVTDPEEIRTI